MPRQPEDAIEPLTTSTDNFSSNAVQGHDLVDSAEFDCLLGHAKNDAGSLVLSNIPRTCLLHFKHSFGTIIAHAGHDDSDCVTARREGG